MPLDTIYWASSLENNRSSSGPSSSVTSTPCEPSLVSIVGMNGRSWIACCGIPDVTRFLLAQGPSWYWTPEFGIPKESIRGNQSGHSMNSAVLAALYMAANSCSLGLIISTLWLG